MKNKTIAIVGLGLMGGSLAAACRKKFPKAQIIGISRNAQARQQALRRHWVHAAVRRLSEGVRTADLIILCTPVNVIQQELKDLENLVRPGTLVTDVGSVKSGIQRWVDQKKHRNISFVGAHPMVGSHTRGIDVSRPDLYEKGLTFVIRGKHTDADAFRKVKLFWKALCSSVIETTSDGHDRIVSEISHLPHALAVCLMLSICPQFLHLSGAGLKDTTRVAAGHPSLWLPIFMGNSRNDARDLGKLEAQIKKFKQSLIANDQKKLFLMLNTAAKKRSQISL